MPRHKALTGAALLLALACSEPGKRITSAELGSDWPFTAEEAWVDCIRGAALVRVEGTTYALTGYARSRGYPAVDPVWMDHPEIPAPAKVDLGAVTERALALCE